MRVGRCGCRHRTLRAVHADSACNQDRATLGIPCRAVLCCAGIKQYSVTDVIKNRAFFLRYGSNTPLKKQDWRNYTAVLNPTVFDQGNVRPWAAVPCRTLGPLFVCRPGYPAAPCSKRFGPRDRNPRLRMRKRIGS